MFLMLFAGNEQAAPRVLAAFEAAGFPVQVAPARGGFEPELLYEFIEVVADRADMDAAVRIAEGHGWSLRLHSLVAPPGANPTLVDGVML